jgi:glucosamine--fructose-6-phosphate aminotransferase (isomerizing)
MPAAGGNLTDAMRMVCQRLEGAFTLVAIDKAQPNLVVAARRNSPLVVGLGEGENFVASDVSAFVDHTRNALELGQDQIVTITPSSVEVITFEGGRLGCLGSREGRLRPLHAQGDRRAAQGRG